MKRDIWYHPTWQMMLDIIMSIIVLPVQNIYPVTRFICANFDNNCMLIIKMIRVADEIKRGIWKNLVSSDVADDA